MEILGSVGYYVSVATQATLPVDWGQSPQRLLQWDPCDVTEMATIMACGLLTYAWQTPESMISAGCPRVTLAGVCHLQWSRSQSCRKRLVDTVTGS